MAMTTAANSQLLDRFLQFVAAATPLSVPPIRVSPPVEAFRHFCTAARFTLRARQASIPLPDFERFVARSRPLLAESMQKKLPEFVRRARALRPWLVGFDLLSIGGLSYVENAYTNLMSWALEPATHPPSAHARQLAWLRTIGLPECTDFQPCTPSVQLRTEDGIPDLVLDYSGFVVVVEAKTGSAEHAAPSGSPQTIAYPAAVRRALGKSADSPLTMVFLSPDGRAATNSDARCVRYADFALALAQSLAGLDPRSEVGAGFAIVVTHLLTAATETETEVKEIVDRLIRAGDGPTAIDDLWIMRNMDLLLSAAALFNGGSHE